MAIVLIVEDDHHIRSIWSEALSLSGNLIAAASNGEQALKHLGTINFDVMILDLNLPGISGLEAIQIVRRDNPGLPILAVTGGHDPDLARSVLEAGANDIVFKPVGLDELTDLVGRLARQK